MPLEGGCSLSPFSLFVTLVGHIHAPLQRCGGPWHIHRMATRRAGGVWRRGTAEGQTRLPPLSPLSLASYLPLTLLRLHFVAVDVVTFGHCPTPSHHHCYCQVDCRIVCATDATSSASHSSSSSLRPYFCTHPPSPPANHRLCAAFLVGAPPPGDAGERALEGVPAAIVVDHAATEDGDGHSPMWHYYA